MLLTNTDVFDAFQLLQLIHAIIENVKVFKVVEDFKVVICSRLSAVTAELPVEMWRKLYFKTVSAVTAVVDDINSLPNFHHPVPYHPLERNIITVKPLYYLDYIIYIYNI